MSTKKMVLKTRGAEMDYAGFMADHLLGGNKTVCNVNRDALQWLHGWLPLNKWLCRFDEKVLARCVCCQDTNRRSRPPLALQGDIALHCNDSAAGFTTVELLSFWVQSQIQQDGTFRYCIVWAHAVAVYIVNTGATPCQKTG